MYTTGCIVNENGCFSCRELNAKPDFIHIFAKNEKHFQVVD